MTARGGRSGLHPQRQRRRHHPHQQAPARSVQRGQRTSQFSTSSGTVTRSMPTGSPPRRRWSALIAASISSGIASSSRACTGRSAMSDAEARLVVQHAAERRQRDQRQPGPQREDDHPPGAVRFELVIDVLESARCPLVPLREHVLSHTRGDASPAGPIQGPERDCAVSGTLDRRDSNRAQLVVDDLALAVAGGRRECAVQRVHQAGSIVHVDALVAAGVDVLDRVVGIVRIKKLALLAVRCQIGLPMLSFW